MQTSMWHACHVECHFWKSRQDEMKVLFTSPTITWRTCNNARIYLTMLFFLALQRGYEFPQPTARVLIGTPSRFTWISLEPIDPPPPPPPPPPSPRMHAETTLRSNVVSDFKTIVKIELLTSSISFLQFLKKTKTYCYEWNELVNTRISRVRQASTSSIEATWTKSSKTCLSVRQKSNAIEETSREAQKELKARRQRDVSRRHCHCQPGNQINAELHDGDISTFIEWNKNKNTVKNDESWLKQFSKLGQNCERDKLELLTKYHRLNSTIYLRILLSKFANKTAKNLNLIHSPLFFACLIAFYMNRLDTTAYRLTYRSRRPGRL